MAPEDQDPTNQPEPPADAADPSRVVGTLLGDRYRVGKRLGQGGMAAVYLATDERLNRTVVVKIPHAALLLDPGFRRRFAAEVSSLTRLEHPNILQIHDVGENDGVPFAVVQHLKGGDLSDRIEQAGGSLAPSQILEWLPRVALTLDYVHSRGFLHRDVSPGNIIFDEHDNAFLSDFGIATALTANDPDETLHDFSNLTKPGGFVGAAAYAPPESIERKLNAGYDQYSLGVVIYEALSGKLPFPRASAEAMLVAKNTKDPTPLTETAPHVPERVTHTVMRAISRFPADRFTSSVAFADSFQAALAATPHAAPTTPPATSPGSVSSPDEPDEFVQTELVDIVHPPRTGATSTKAAEKATAKRRETKREKKEEKANANWKPILAFAGAVALVGLAGLAWRTGYLGIPRSESQTIAARVTFDAGSTTAEKQAAYDLCVRHLTTDGCDRADYADETFRRATVGPISIDRHEVTNAQFAAWVEQSAHKTTAETQGYSWHGLTKGTNLSWRAPTRGKSYLDLPTHPVVHVSRADAGAYCAAAGSRLPTEDEWEFSARGIERRELPWGEWDPGVANWGGTGRKATAPVGSTTTGASWGELEDMAGNVWEWTSTEVPAGSGTDAILKGGSWLEADPANLRGAARLFESPDYTSSDAGFRCVKDL